MKKVNGFAFSRRSSTHSFEKSLEAKKVYYDASGLANYSNILKSLKLLPYINDYNPDTDLLIEINITADPDAVIKSIGKFDWSKKLLFSEYEKKVVFKSEIPQTEPRFEYMNLLPYNLNVAEPEIYSLQPFSDFYRNAGFTDKVHYDVSGYIKRISHSKPPKLHIKKYKNILPRDIYYESIRNERRETLDTFSMVDYYEFFITQIRFVFKFETHKQKVSFLTKYKLSQ